MHVALPGPTPGSFARTSAALGQGAGLAPAAVPGSAASTRTNTAIAQLTVRRIRPRYVGLERGVYASDEAGSTSS
jgi:hypothetical protein